MTYKYLPKVAACDVCVGEFCIGSEIRSELPWDFHPIEVIFASMSLLPNSLLGYVFCPGFRRLSTIGSAESLLIAKSQSMFCAGCVPMKPPSSRGKDFKFPKNVVSKRVASRKFIGHSGLPGGREKPGHALYQLFS